MKINSRAKGARGELQACEFMNHMTTVHWERTAQRWGKATADIWAPSMPDLGLHIEVKNYGTLLKRPTSMATLHKLVDTPDGMQMCLAVDVAQVMQSQVVPVHMSYHNMLSDFMAQASRDARDSALPFILFKRDYGNWIALWKKEHRRAIWAVLQDIWKPTDEA